MRGRRPVSFPILLVLVVAVSMAIPPAAATAAPSCPPDSTSTIAANEPLILVGTCIGSGDVSYTFPTLPAHGSLAAVGDGDTAIYTPNLDFAGTDTLVYRATDGSGSTDRAVTIIVLAASGPGGLPPSCPDPAVAFVPLGATVTLNAPCRDPEGVPLTYVVGNTWIPQATYNPDNLNAPDFGSWVVGTIVPNVSIDYAHNASNGYAEDSFEYTATDGSNKVRFPATLKITNPALPPVYSTAAEATPADPFTASVETWVPGTGAVIAVRDPSTPPPPGYFFFGQEYHIQAAPQTVADPLRLTFTIDSSRAPQGDDVDIFRNGSLVRACTELPKPDPCFESRGFLAGSGDYQIVVLTSQASVYQYATSVNYPFSDFFEPVNNLPMLNVAKGGSAIPVKFSLGGDEGLDILAPGYPKSERIACETGASLDDIESTVTAGGSSLQYDPVSGRYTYVWKTEKAWSGTCRRLDVKLDDGTTHTAKFQFKK